jgi:hypothetical protein
MDNQTADAAGTATLRTFDLDHDVVVNGNTVYPAGSKITVRKPNGGALRGLSMSALMQADYTSLETLAPRITAPAVQKHEFAAFDPADIVQFAGEVMDFLLPKAARPDSLNA